MYLLSALFAAINAVVFLLIVVIPQLSQNDNTIRLLGIWNLFVTLGYFSLAGGLATKRRNSYDGGITLGLANAFFIYLQASQTGQVSSSAALVLIALDLAMVITIYASKQTLPIQVRPTIEVPEEQRIERAVSEKAITDEEAKLLMEMRDAYARDKKALRDQIINGVRVDIAFRYGIMDQQTWEYYSFVPIATPEVMKRLFIPSRLQLSGGSVHYIVAIDITPDAYSAVPDSVGGVYVLRKREKIIRIGPSGQFEFWLGRNYRIAFLPVDENHVSAPAIKAGEQELFKGNVRRGFCVAIFVGGLFLAVGGGSLYAIAFADQFWVKLVTLAIALLSLFFVVLAIALMYWVPKLELIITESGIKWSGYQMFRRVIITRLLCFAVFDLTVYQQ